MTEVLKFSAVLELDAWLLLEAKLAKIPAAVLTALIDVSKSIGLVSNV